MKKNIKQDLKNIENDSYFINKYGVFLADYYKINAYIQRLNNRSSNIVRKIRVLEDKYDQYIDVETRTKIFYKLSQSRNRLALLKESLITAKKSYVIEKKKYELDKLDKKLAVKTDKIKRNKI